MAFWRSSAVEAAVEIEQAAPVDVTGFSKFGTMTSGGGLAAIFDGTGSSTTGHAEATTGTAGIDFRSAPQAVDSILLTSAANGWDGSSSEGGAVTFKLYGKQGAQPANQTDGTLLGTSGPIKDINAVRTHAVYSSDWLTEWDWIWVQVTTPTWAVLSDFKLYPPAIPQIGATRRILRRRCDGSQPISKNISNIYGLRFLFELTQPAIIDPRIKVEVEHMEWATGIGYLLSCGALLKYRSAASLAALASASYATIDVAGINLSAEGHYGRQDLLDGVYLDAGFHEILPALNSNTYESSEDWYTNVLVEGGEGLNKGVIIIDPTAGLIKL